MIVFTLTAVVLVVVAVVGLVWLIGTAAGSAGGRHRAGFTAEEYAAANRDLERAFKTLDDAIDEVERRGTP